MDPEKAAVDPSPRASLLDPLRGGPLDRPAPGLVEPAPQGGARHLQDASHVLEPAPLVEQRERRAKVHLLARATAVLPRRLGPADAGEDALADQGPFVVRECPQQLQPPGRRVGVDAGVADGGDAGAWERRPGRRAAFDERQPPNDLQAGNRQALFPIMADRVRGLSSL